ncbi:single-stranded-DNA-specific exonuclease RecJ [Elioraea sp.]|uniref:single-stranded-DNA-specific exonuclease RecJ n=1 Tax=Elioraea sp. TaxID=2185103 RepID=UPI003F713D92
MDGGLTVSAPAALSFSGRRWVARAGDAGAAALLAQAHGLPEPLARLIALRGIAAADLDRHLTPRLRDWLPDPSALDGMDTLAARLADAVRRGETVAVFGDYDVDGAAATALMRRFLGAVGGHAVHAVPDRLRDGYGPNAAAFAALADAGARVILCVDCGSAAPGPIAGIAPRADVLVLDHHRVDRAPEAAVAHVNPTLAGPEGLAPLCAAGLAFLAAVGVNRVLRETGWPRALDAATLLSLVDLVALATVADVVPLVGVNRAFVTQGLALMAVRPRAGIAALLRVAGVTRPPDAEAIGFALAPRLNAAGRIGNAELGVQLLLSDETAEAEGLAQRLDALNRERQRIEAGVLDAALAAAERQAGAGRPVILVAGEGWHAGVVGIVAGRVKERFGRPAFVLGIAGGLATGSGRSVPGVHLGDAVRAAVAAGIAIKAGGHAMAAGVTLSADRLGALHELLCAACLGATEGPEALVLDGTMTVEGATAELARAVARLGPFGAGNPEPVFSLRGRLGFVGAVGATGAHLRLAVTGEGGGRLNAIAFRAAGGALGRGLASALGATVVLAGVLREDHFRGGASASLQVIDASPA